MENSRDIEIRSELKLLLNTMFDNDPAKRLTLSEILSNSWVRGKTASK